MAYQQQNNKYNNTNKPTYGQKKDAAPAQSNNSDQPKERPVGSLQQVVPGDRTKGDKDQYLDVGGLWKRVSKKDGRPFYVATGMKGTAFEGIQFIVTLREP